MTEHATQQPGDSAAQRQGKTAFLFPGQGSQKVGMGQYLLENRPDLADTYYRAADDILGIPLSTLCWEGPEDALRDTAITQPAVFLTSLATLDVLREHGLRPDVVAGHSLGEYTALVAAGVLDWQDALRLVRRRGELMAAVNEQVPGAMAAVLGLDLATVEEICAKVAAETGQVAEVANDNEPGQSVVSGQAEAIERVRVAAQEAGAVKAIALPVGAPFHCALMRGIEEEFAAELDRVTFREPQLPVISGVTAEHVTSAADITACLRRQLAGRVRWTGSVQLMADSGVTDFVEVGPGKVLSGLCRRIVPELTSFTTHDERRLVKTLDALAPTAAVAAV
ncbi:ACP S-malonyltransferase [Streptomyces zagrosensis]|uniref:Malonyl CoA-acyl carrier protein transacylase n=1 Tax=Streptomyces zagrosensis TaxID=1042984 RepID=A0A7W9QH43_9ACTN|nr:ACP S-malonyltransferase [Streptomyces zagrosensis]MBB5940175.1 [acyl-carrier-protein] S-malonyltransferase [Streptomyces zagrosensis]